MKPEPVQQPFTELIFNESQLSFPTEDPNPPHTEFGPEDKIVTPYAGLSSTDYVYEARIINWENYLGYPHNGKVRFLVLKSNGTIVREFLLWIRPADGAPEAANGVPAIAVTLERMEPPPGSEQARQIIVRLTKPPGPAGVIRGDGGGSCGAPCQPNGFHHAF